VLKFCLSQIGVSPADLETWYNSTERGDQMLWLLGRAIGIPGALHGGTHRRCLVNIVFNAVDEIVSDSKEYRQAIKKTDEWLNIGSTAATIGCVRYACYNALTKFGNGDIERHALYLIMFAGNYNVGYPYRTAYDDAYDAAICGLALPNSTWANLVRKHCPWSSIQEILCES
jgi:hypothetical protein